MPDVPLGQRGQQRVAADQGLPVHAVLGHRPHHVRAVRDHRHVAGLVPAVDHAPGAVVADRPPVAQLDDRRAEMQHVAHHAAGVGAVDGGADDRRVRAVHRHVDVPARTVDQLDRVLLDGRPARERTQHPVAVHAGRLNSAGELALGPGQPFLEGIRQVSQELVGRHRHEPGRLGVDGRDHALRGQPAQRLVHLRLRDPGDVGQRVPGERLTAEQPHVGLRLVLGEPQLDQAAHRPLLAAGLTAHHRPLRSVMAASSRPALRLRRGGPAPPPAARAPARRWRGTPCA